MPRFAVRDIPFSLKSTGQNGPINVVVPNAANLNPTASIGMSIWLYPTGVPKAFIAFDKTQNGATNSYYMSVAADGSPLWFSIIGGIVRNITGTGKSHRVIWGQWNLLEAGYNGSAVELFLNGAKLTEEITGISGDIGVTTQELRIASYWTGLLGLNLEGFYYRPMLHPSTPTLAQHQAHWFNRAPSAEQEANALLDLRMLSGSGTNLTDHSQYGTDGTLDAAISSWDAQYVPSKLRTAISIPRLAFTKPRFAAGFLPIVNADFSDVPTFVAPQTAAGWIDGTATGSQAGLPFGWAVGTPTGSVEVQYDQAVTINGKPTLRLSTKATGSRATVSSTVGATRLGMTQAMAVQPNTTYTARYKMITSLVSGDSADGASVGFVERTSEGALVIVRSATPVKTTTGETEYSVTFTTSATTCFISIRPDIIGNTGAATLIMDAWFGDISIYSASLPRTAVS